MKHWRFTAGLSLALWLVVTLPVSAQESLQAASASDLGATVSVNGNSAAGGVVDITWSMRVSALPRGSRINIKPHWRMGVALQTTSAQANNYLSATVDGDGEPLLFSPNTTTSLPGGPRSIQEIASFVAKTDIAAGSNLRITIINLALPEQASNHYSIEVEVPSGDRPGPVHSIPVPVTSGPPSQLRVTAESMTAPGDDVGLMVRTEDAFGNRASFRAGQALSLDLRVNGRFSQRVEVAEPVQRIAGISFSEPGVHTVELRSAGGGLRGTSNPIIVGDNLPDIDFIIVKEPVVPPRSLYTAQEANSFYEGLADLVLPSSEPGSSRLQSGSGWQTEHVTRPVESGGNIYRLIAGRQAMNVVLAETPTDLRAVSGGDVLVEIAAGNSVYEWNAHRVAGLGLARGFIGANHSNQPGGQQRLVRTGVARRPGESLQEAIFAGRTFVNAGEPVVIVDSINAGGARRVPLSDERLLQADITAAGPVSNIELFKNGKLLTAFPASTTRSQSYRLTFASSSRPFSDSQVLPRNPREWLGFVQVRIGTLQPRTEKARVRLAPSGQRFDFLGRTHGRIETIAFDLIDGSDDTVIEVMLAANHEATNWLPVDRLPAPTPSANFQFPMSEVLDGNAVRIAPGAGYEDTITIEPMASDDRSRQTVTYTDRSKPRVGDYYYFRVTLTDGSMAWSSPLYVGGTATPPAFSFDSIHNLDRQQEDRPRGLPQSQ